MGNKRVAQVLQRVAEATPSGKLPSERESDAMRLVKSIGSAARKVSSRNEALGPRGQVDSKPTSNSEPKG